MERRHAWLIVVLCLAGFRAEAVSKCRDDSGTLIYLQTRSCPAHLESLPFEPPPLNRIETRAGAHGASKPSLRARRSRPATDPLVASCGRLKNQFKQTNEPCRGVAGCRQRNHRRRALRERYKADFCFTRTGAIDSF